MSDRSQVKDEEQAKLKEDTASPAEIAHVRYLKHLEGADSRHSISLALDYVKRLIAAEVGKPPTTKLEIFQKLLAEADNLAVDPSIIESFPGYRGIPEDKSHGISEFTGRIKFIDDKALYTLGFSERA